MGKGAPFDFGLTFGDNFYPSGMTSPDDTRWRDWWESLYGPLGVVFYPSLLDPQSPSRNFEDTGDHAYIYLTDIHPEACHIGTNRDLLRIPVAIGVSPAAPGQP